MLKNSNDLGATTAPFIEEFNRFCSDHNLLGKINADHIGLKCSSSELYEKQRSFFEFQGKFVYQSIISKRRISIIGLLDVINTEVGELRYLELSDQKPDNSQKDYIDHLEVVPIGMTYNELLLLLQSSGVVFKEIVRSHHTTHDTVLPSGFIIRLSHEMLIDKIKREEML